MKKYKTIIHLALKISKRYAKMLYNWTKPEERIEDLWENRFQG